MQSKDVGVPSDYGKGDFEAPFCARCGEREGLITIPDSEDVLCGKCVAPKTIHNLIANIEHGAAELQRLIAMKPADLLGARYVEQAVYQCADCGEVYFEGEDARVQAGIKCAQCAYPQGDNF